MPFLGTRGVNSSRGFGFAGASAVPPVNTVAPAVSGTARVGQSLSTTTGTWTGTAPIAYTYQWQRNTSNISGATSSTYTLVTADAGNTVRCVVTATNSAGNSSANSNSTVTVTQTPSNTVAPTISGSNDYVGTTWTSTTGTWAGSPTPTYTYQWTRAGSNISGATSSTYTLATADIGTSVRCVVTATNSAGSASANSSNIVSVQAKPAVAVSTYLTSSLTRASVFVYNWNNGFGSIYAGSPDLGTGSAGVRALAFNSKGTVLMLVQTESPYVQAYSFSASGWGSKYANPATTPGYFPLDGKFNPAQNAFAGSLRGSPGIWAYPWNDSSGWGTKFADPSGWTNQSDSVNWYPNGAYVFKTGSSVYNGMTGYGFSASTGFTTGGIVNNDQLMGSGYVATWSRSGGSFYGTWGGAPGYVARYTNPWPEGLGVSPIAYGSQKTIADPRIGGPSGGSYNGPELRPLSSDIYAMGHDTAYQTTLAAYSATTPYANPAEPETQGIRGIGFSGDGATLSYTYAASPYLRAYAFSTSTGLGTRYASPSTPPNNLFYCNTAWIRAF